MKKLTLFILTLIIFVFYSCTKDSSETSPLNSTGKLLIKSIPPGAQIFLKGINTGKTTPYTVENLEQGTYNGFLYLQYYDTTYFTANVFNNTTTTVDTTLKDGLPFVEFLFDFQIAFGGDSVQFNFTINQDVTIDSIAVQRPINNSGFIVTEKYLFNAELFECRELSGNLKKYYLPPSGSGPQYYQAIQNINYNFGMFGHKAYGAKVEFRSYYQVAL